ncbi:hypothetical protein Nepgr_026636 [Nepenthes gracilis]|uniref:Uncharacterized protein n=1 Tax=Nepenthes gracilis TaxID=150966 RepID=A0AAD3Y0R3_NEPGR|nr:hypothetical protein Nepgr_026636 [Nepenthes gracilis]
MTSGGGPSFRVPAVHSLLDGPVVEDCGVGMPCPIGSSPGPCVADADAVTLPEQRVFPIPLAEHSNPDSQAAKTWGSIVSKDSLDAGDLPDETLGVDVLVEYPWKPGQSDPSQRGKQHKIINKVPSKIKTTGGQATLAPVDSVRLGKGPWRIKYKNIPAAGDAGPVRESNAFAALQCPEADAMCGSGDGNLKRDGLGSPGPDSSSNLNREGDVLRSLPSSENELENRDAPPVEIEGPLQEGNIKSLGGRLEDLPLTDEEKMERAPPLSSSLCNPSDSRSTRSQA